MSQDFSLTKSLRQTSIMLQENEQIREITKERDKEEEKGVEKDQNALNIEKPDKVEKSGLSAKSKGSKASKKIVKKIELGLMKEKVGRGRRKIPSEPEDQLDIEEPTQKSPVKPHWSRINKELFSPEIPPDSNVASIDPKMLMNEHRKPRSIYPKDGELSFKNKDEGLTGESRKPSNFSFEGANTTFGEFGGEQIKSVFKRNEQASTKSERGRENKEILNKMRQPITNKPERENALRNTQQGSENSSHPRDDDEDEFPFDDFGF